MEPGAGFSAAGGGGEPLRPGGPRMSHVRSAVLGGPGTGKEAAQWVLASVGNKGTV